MVGEGRRATYMISRAKAWYVNPLNFFDCFYLFNPRFQSNVGQRETHEKHWNNAGKKTWKALQIVIILKLSQSSLGLHLHFGLKCKWFLLFRTLRKLKFWKTRIEPQNVSRVQKVLLTLVFTNLFRNHIKFKLWICNLVGKTW